MRGRRMGVLILAGLSMMTPAWAASTRGRSPARVRATAQRPAAPTAAQSQAAVKNVLEMITDRVWDHGDYYWHNGRYADRIASDRLVIAMDPTFIEPYGTSGWLLENTGKDSEAIAIYLKATKVAPQRWETWNDVGMFYFQRRKYPEAIDAYQHAVKLKGVTTFVWHQLAHSYERSGQLQKALDAWEKARSLDPADGVVDLNEERIQRKMKEGTSRGERG